MRHPDDAVLCQALLRGNAVSVDALGACAEAQRAAERLGGPVPRLGELLLSRGLLTAAQLDAVQGRRDATPPARRRRPSSGRLRAVDEASLLDGGGGAGAGDVVPGDRLGPYEVVERIANGTMGTVFRARCARTGQSVALKVISNTERRQPSPERFLREARLATALRHDGLVRGLGLGLERGRRFFAMELVDGPSLRARIEAEGALGEGDVAAIGAQLASALEYLHGEGIVHRDVKPANVLVSATTGRAKLCDLGLARELDLPSEATGSCDTLGTPRYMAPEQARGAREIGPPADLYALGVTLFHAATGRPPFPEESGLVVISRHLFDEVPDARTLRAGLSPALAALLWRLTRKQPELRPCAAEAAATFAALAGDRAPARAAA